MLLVMMVSPLTQGSRQAGPDRIEQHRPDGRLRQCALDLPDDVRAHCQIGRVDLEYKAGVDHSAIFVRHLAGDRIQRGLVRGVIRIQHGGRDDAPPAQGSNLHAQARSVSGLHLCIYARARSAPAEADLQRRFGLSPPAVHRIEADPRRLTTCFGNVVIPAHLAPERSPEPYLLISQLGSR